MGACDFRERVTTTMSTTTETAFHDLVDRARYDHGHAGYTGTIAEKHGFVTRHAHVFGSEADAMIFVEDDLSHNQKWGPCFHVMFDAGPGHRGHIFYGMASS
jgi:hypothetical protein